MVLQLQALAAWMGSGNDNVMAEKAGLVRASVLNVAEGQDGKQKVILGSTP